jgi:hypothetical protein
MDFESNEEIDEEKLNKLVEAIAARLHAASPLRPGDGDLRRGWFDTPFRNATDHLLDDTTLIYHGQEYKRSEVNYLGQGMWGAAAGESLEETLAFANKWKQDFWGEAGASEGVKFWTAFGYQHMD